MTSVLLNRSYAHNDILLWFAVLALLIILLGGRWLYHRLSAYISNVVQKCWPLC